MLRLFRQQAPTLLLALFLGLLLQMAVAWACHLRITPSVTELDTTGTRPWPGRFAASTTLAGYYHRSEGFGRTTEVYFLDPRPQSSPTEQRVWLYRAGWPMRAFSMMEGIDAAGAGFTDHAVRIPDVAPFPAWSRAKFVPVMPLFPGFAVNLAIYASATWCLLAAVSAARALWRRARGTCPRCGYPCGEWSVCPECGRSPHAPVRQRHPKSATPVGQTPAL